MYVQIEGGGVLVPIVIVITQNKKNTPCSHLERGGMLVTIIVVIA